MAMKRSRCTPLHERIDSVMDEVDDLETMSGTEINVQDEGTPLGLFHTINVVGAIIEATDGGSGVAVFTVTGTAGSQNLFETISVAGQSDIVADSPTDVLTFAAGANIVITTTPGTDTLTIAVSGLNIFDAIAVSGQDTVVAGEVSEQLTFVAGTNMTITTSNTTKTITFASSGGGGGGSVTAGDGIDVSGDEVSVDLATEKGLQFVTEESDEKVAAWLVAAGGLEFRNEEDAEDGAIQDRWRYHYVKGLATSAQTPGHPGLDNVMPIHGEDPGSPLVTGGLNLWCADNEVIYAKFDNEGASDVSESWTTDVMANLRPILAGLVGYDPTKDLAIVHDANETDAGQQSIKWAERTTTTIWGLDPAGGHSLSIVTGTTLRLHLVIKKYTFDAINLTTESSSIDIDISGTSCD